MKTALQYASITTFIGFFKCFLEDFEKELPISKHSPNEQAYVNKMIAHIRKCNELFNKIANEARWENTDKGYTAAIGLQKDGFEKYIKHILLKPDAPPILVSALRYLKS